MAKANTASKEGAAETVGEGGFRAASLVMVALAASALFLLALYALLGERDGRDRGDARAPSANGVTAIGLGALNDMLRRLDYPVVAKAGVSGEAPVGAVVIVTDLNDAARLQETRYRFEQAGTILVVLPKWRIPWSTFGRRFAERVWRVPSSEPTRAAANAMKAGRAESEAKPGLEREEGAFSPPTRNPLSVAPTIDKAQLLTGGGLIPVIARADGAMLLAEVPVDDSRLPPLFILSDPDPLLNHGVDDGENAEFAIRLLEWLGAGDGGVAFDDGPGAPKSPASFWASLFEPPLLAVTIAILALFGALGLLALGRFGSRAVDRPGQAAGKEALLDAAAALLRQGDGDRIVIRRFLEESMRDAAARLSAPSMTERTALLDWFDKVEQTRRMRRRLKELDQAVAAAEAAPRSAARPERLTALAQEINAWREEMLRGQV